MSRNIHSVLMAGLGCLAACTSIDAPGSDDVVSPQQEAVHGVSHGNDVDTLEANVVVKLKGSVDPTGHYTLCSGTLISPTAVLTAQHCVTGDTDGGNGMLFPVTVQLGNRDAFPRNHIASDANVVFPGHRFHVPSVGRDGDEGFDLAIVWLDEPILDEARIVRPTLLDPESWSQPGLRGLAGWAPSDSNGTRQVGIQGSFNVTRNIGSPADLGRRIEFRDEVVAPGDSGGPLFIQRPDGTRDVLGVLSGHYYESFGSCGGSSCTVWTDVTVGAPRSWVVDQMLDRTPRSARWKAKHPAHLWKGEVDYTGTCDHAHDVDCDHWYDEHDNCWSILNVDQADSDDDGIGDACSTWKPMGGWLQGGDSLRPASETFTMVRSPAFSSLRALGIGGDNGVYESYGRAGFWSTWTPLPSRGWVKKIAALGSARGIELFGIGSDDRVYFQRQRSTGTWSGWVQVPYDYAMMKDIVVVAGGPGDEVLFGIDQFGRVVWHPIYFASSPSRITVEGTSFAGWQSIPGLSATARQLSAVNIDGRLELVALLADGTVWRAPEIVDGAGHSWGSWTSVAAGAQQVVAAATPLGTTGGRRLEVFTLSEGRVARYPFSEPGPDGRPSRFGYYLPFVSQTLVQIAVAHNGEGGVGNGRLEVFGLDAAGHVSHVWQTVVERDEWAGAADRPAPASSFSQLVAIENGLGFIEVMALDRQSHMPYVDWQYGQDGLIYWQY